MSEPMTPEELAKISPAMALGSHLMNSGMSFEEMADALRDMPGVEVKNELQGNPFVNPGPDPNFPDRPDHPDFRELSHVVQAVDTKAEASSDDPGGSVLAFTGMDENSLLYMAEQRAKRAKEKLPNVGDVGSATFIWVDGFTMGYLLATSKAPTVQQLLDESIDGAHRPPREDR